MGGSRLLDGPHGEVYVFELYDLALIIERPLFEQAGEGFQFLLESLDAIGLCEAERAVFGLAVAQPHAEHEAALRHGVERGDLLGHVHRVVKSEQQDAGADGHIARVSRHLGDARPGLHHPNTLGEIVLSAPNAVKAQIPNQAHLFEMLLPAFRGVIPQGVLVHDEHAEFHITLSVLSC